MVFTTTCQRVRALYNRRLDLAARDGANLVTARVHLGEAPLSDLLVDDKVPDGIVACWPCPPRGRYSFSHGFVPFPARVDGNRGLVTRRNSPKAYAIRKTSAAGLIVMYVEDSLVWAMRRKGPAREGSKKGRR